MSRLKKALCLFLSVVFLFQLLPVTALAADGDASYTNESFQPVDMSDAVAADEIAVLGEDTSLREEFTKQYTLENGAKMAVVYPSAVHYEENGAWQDIDNRLNETTASYTVAAHAGVPTGAVVSEEQGGGITDAAGTASADAALDYSETLDITEPALRNAAGALSVTFPTSLTDTNRIAVTHRGYTLYFRPDGASSSSAVSSAPETPVGANARMTAVHTESSVTYAGVYGGADIRYDLQSNSLKESYILQSLASTSEVYSSTIAAPGLTPKLHEDGSIDFTDENGEIIFYIPPSYLYDADGLIGNVAVELYTLNTGEYAMVCRPDHDWLSDSARSWPVTLDPTIYTMLSTSSFEDCYVKDNSPGRAYPSTINLIVGNAGTSGVCRAYIRINDLPSIGSSDVIVSAKLHYYCEFSSKVSGTVESSIYQVTAPEWVDYNGIYWNGQPACNETALDFKLNNNRRMGYNIFDITRAARGWYAGELNNGLMIKSMDESTYCWYYYYAKENSGNNRYPKLEIFYINTSGLEECWDYTSQSLGRAGTAYVQDFSGNYLLSRTDMSYGGSRMSAAPGFCYSLAARANDIGYGYGWRSNYAQSIEACTVSGTSYYRWTDGDGTEKYFVSANGVWKDELGYGYTLTVSDSGYTITDKKSNTMEFSSAGQLAAVKDAYGNAISITSDGSRVTALTDGAGRHYAFAYSDGRLTQLTYTGAGSDAIETVTYAYTAAGDLASVTYHDGESVTYAWDGAHIMTSASDIENADGSRDTLSVSCSSASPARTTALSYNVAQYFRNIPDIRLRRQHDEGDGQPRAVRHLPVQQLRQHDGGVQQRGTGAVWAVRAGRECLEPRQPAAFELPPPERVPDGGYLVRNGADRGHVRDDLARGPRQPPLERRYLRGYLRHMDRYGNNRHRRSSERGKRRGGDPRRIGHERAAPDGQGDGLEAVYADGDGLRHGGGYLHVWRLGEGRDRSSGQRVHGEPDGLPAPGGHCGNAL